MKELSSKTPDTSHSLSVEKSYKLSFFLTIFGKCPRQYCEKLVKLVKPVFYTKTE